MCNEHHGILIANRLLWRCHARELDELYAGLQPPYGCSLWPRKRERATQAPGISRPLTPHGSASDDV
jgi:hypothetical protein